MKRPRCVDVIGLLRAALIVSTAVVGRRVGVWRAWHQLLRSQYDRGGSQRGSSVFNIYFPLWLWSLAVHRCVRLVRSGLLGLAHCSIVPCKQQHEWHAGGSCLTHAPLPYYQSVSPTYGSTAVIIRNSTTFGHIHVSFVIYVDVVERVCG